MTENTGKVVSINGNLVSVQFDGNVSMNEICFVKVGNTALKSEVIRIRGDIAQIQVYEMTNGIQCGDPVEFTGDMLSADLGPGLLGQVYDGLQNPLTWVGIVLVIAISIYRVVVLRCPECDELIVSNFGVMSKSCSKCGWKLGQEDEPRAESET